MAEPTKSKGVRLSLRLWEAAERAAEAEGRSLNGFLAQAVRDAVSASTAHLVDKPERQAERQAIIDAMKGIYGE